ncbi:MAG: FAD binding domain-containing protein [Acidimicrobiales bacterium]
MKLPGFRYHRPDTVDEALALLAEHGDEAKVLAGGQSLIPLMALRLSQPAHLVDIGTLTELATIEDRGGVAFGALARHADIEHSDLVARAAPLLSAAMPFIGHRAIRNRGTACGSLAHADPAGELPAIALALDAQFVLRAAAGERTVAAADFFLGYLSSAVGDAELLTEVRLPQWPASAGWSVQEVSRRHGDYALVGMTVVLDGDASGGISDAAIALFGASSTPVRIDAAERLLVGETPGPELFESAADAVRANVDPPGDNHGTSAYRRHLAGVLTRRCLVEAAERMGAAA